MPNTRSVVFANDEIYHVYNRSVANEEIFITSKYINRVLALIRYYKDVSDIRFSFFNNLDYEKKLEFLKSKTSLPLVEIYAYSLMPNHFHILVKQLSENGIKIFLSNFQNGFAKFYNIKNKRFGALFQRPFKAKHVSSDEEFLHLSRYIHLNPVTSYLITFNNLKKSSITSLPYYLNNHDNSFINTKQIISMIKTPDKYLQFLHDQIDYQRKLNRIKHLILE